MGENRNIVRAFLLFTFFFAGFLFPVGAQQTAQYSLPHLNRYHFNPAYAGMDRSLSLTGVTRNQWNNITGSPSTQNLNFHLPFYFLNGGMGMKFENDRLGASRLLRITASYNYVLQFDRAIVSVGAAIGIDQYTLDGGKLRARDGIYEGNIFNHNDPRIPVGKQSDVLPGFETGVYVISGRFEGGISLVNMGTGEFSIPVIDGEMRFQRKPTAHLSSSYTMALSSVWDFQPSILISTDLTEYQLTGILGLRYNNQFNIAVGWRGFSSSSIDAAIASVGYVVNEHFEIHYAYDIGISTLANRSAGSHEFVVKYNLNKKIGAGSLPKIIYNPRFL
jgi:type IX secretion system PorP/SprF family membrane protein